MHDNISQIVNVVKKYTTSRDNTHASDTMADTNGAVITRILTPQEIMDKIPFPEIRSEKLALCRGVCQNLATAGNLKKGTVVHLTERKIVSLRESCKRRYSPFCKNKVRFSISSLLDKMYVGPDHTKSWLSIYQIAHTKMLEALRMDRFRWKFAHFNGCYQPQILD